MISFELCFMNLMYVKKINCRILHSSIGGEGEAIGKIYPMTNGVKVFNLNLM